MLLDTPILFWGLLCWGLFSTLAGAPRAVLTDAQRARAQEQWERRVAKGKQKVAQRQARERTWRQHEALTAYRQHVKRLRWS